MTEAYIYTRNAQTGKLCKIAAPCAAGALSVVSDRSEARKQVRALSVFPHGAVLACLDGGRVAQTSGPVGPEVA